MEPRLLRCQHPAGCAVFLTAQNATFTQPDGTVEKADDQPGAVTCGDASVHLPANAGEQQFELILVELKNRETFNWAADARWSPTR